MSLSDLAPWVVASVAAVGVGYTLYRDFVYNRRKLVYRRWRGHFVDDDRRNDRIRLINTSRTTMQSDDLKRPIRIEIPGGQLQVAGIELHQGKYQPICHVKPTKAAETFIEINDVSLNRGDYLEFHLILRDCKQLPELSLQADGFSIKRLKDVID